MIEPDLIGMIAPLVGGRCYPDVAPANAALPYATFQQIGGKPLVFMEAQPASKKHARFQINVWSATRKEATTIIRSIEDAVVIALGDVEGGAASTYDAAQKFYGARQDFSFWFDA